MNPLSNPDTVNLNPDWPEDLSENEIYEGDYRCAVADGPDDPCRKVATMVYREPFTPARVAVLACSEHADGLEKAGYHFDKEATIQLCRDVEREQEVLA